MAMGRNMDLYWHLGVPETITCPKCKAECTTSWDDEDIECGRNPEAGKWALYFSCDACESEFVYEFRATQADVEITEVEP